MPDLTKALHHIASQGLPRAEVRIEHQFFPGLYLRQMLIPKGTFIIGKKHKEPLLNVLSSGHMAVLMNDQIQELRAPFMAYGKAERKAGYAIEDSVWCNVIQTELTDVEAIEAAFTEEEVPCLLSQ